MGERATRIRNLDWRLSRHGEEVAQAAADLVQPHSVAPTRNGADPVGDCLAVWVSGCVGPTARVGVASRQMPSSRPGRFVRTQGTPQTRAWGPSQPKAKAVGDGENQSSKDPDRYATIRWDGPRGPVPVPGSSCLAALRGSLTESNVSLQEWKRGRGACQGRSRKEACEYV